MLTYKLTSSHQRIVCDMAQAVGTFHIGTDEPGPRHGGDFGSAGAGLRVGQASRPHAHLVAGIECETARTVELEHLTNIFITIVIIF